jgi:hypothetical protein
LRTVFKAATDPLVGDDYGKELDCFTRWKAFTFILLSAAKLDLKTKVGI